MSEEHQVLVVQSDSELHKKVKVLERIIADNATVLRELRRENILLKIETQFLIAITQRNQVE